MNVHTCAHSVVVRATTCSPGLAAPRYLATEDFISAARSPRLHYIDFSFSIIPRLPFTYSTSEHSLIFDRVCHPYNPDAFDLLLLKYGLFSDYSLLSYNLRHGFPLGHMPLLSQTIILPNNPSILSHLDTIKEYLQKELDAGRMSGPFSREETELILRGPFQSSPLIVSVQPQQPGTPDKLWICQHLSKSTKVHPLVNSYIHKEDFPTRFDLASKVADMVSLLFNLFPFIFFVLYLCTLLRFVCGAAFFSLQCAIRIFASRMCYPDNLSSWRYIECLPSSMVGMLNAHLVYGACAEHPPHLWGTLSTLLICGGCIEYPSCLWWTC